MLRFGTGFCFLCGVKNKSGLNNMSIMVVFKKIVYLCSKFMQVSFLCELTYCILADLSARLNLVNSTLEARISHSRFVAFSEGTDRFACFASRPTRAEPRKWQMGFRVLPFCKWTRRNCGNPLEEANFKTNHYVPIKFPKRQCADLQFFRRVAKRRKAFRRRSTDH